MFLIKCWIFVWKIWCFRFSKNSRDVTSTLNLSCAFQLFEYFWPNWNSPTLRQGDVYFNFQHNTSQIVEDQEVVIFFIFLFKFQDQDGSKYDCQRRKGVIRQRRRTYLTRLLSKSLNKVIRTLLRKCLHRLRRSHLAVLEDPPLGPPLLGLPLCPHDRRVHLVDGLLIQKHENRVEAQGTITRTKKTSRISPYYVRIKGPVGPC